MFVFFVEDVVKFVEDDWIIGEGVVCFGEYDGGFFLFFFVCELLCLGECFVGGFWWCVDGFFGGDFFGVCVRGE